MKFSKFIDSFEEGVFSNLTNKKVELEKKGKKIYDLFVGTPDFPVDFTILQAIKENVTAEKAVEESVKRQTAEALEKHQAMMAANKTDYSRKNESWKRIRMDFNS